VIYTAPIKALSNQKFREFDGLFPGQVGILTGDITHQPNAPLVIMTTEIFHNQILEEKTGFERFTWIIFDEIHYIDDAERGTVWEESLIFMPPHMHLLALSATIPNREEFAGWLSAIHAFPVRLVHEETRPVPLHFFFQCYGKLTDDVAQLQRIGYRKLSGTRRPVEFDAEEERALNRVPALIAHLQSLDRLPCIYFAFSRKRCEALAEQISHLSFLNAEDSERLRLRFRSLLRQFELEGEEAAEDLEPLVVRGVAFHHAGMRPAVKEVIERLFTERLIQVIFTTETFALGINMPARTVIFDELRKIYGRYHRALRTRDFFQMAGRAGRRGIDDKGYVYVRVSPHDIELAEIERMLAAKFEPVQSQFRPSYATLLNLYEKYGDRLTDIYPLSFHCFQQGKNNQKRAVAAMRGRVQVLKRLGFIEDNTLTPKGHFGKRVYGYELALTEFYMRGIMEGLTEEELVVLAVGLVYEPRKLRGDYSFHPMSRQLRRHTRRIMGQIWAAERDAGVIPPSKEFYFYLTETLISWIRGEPFADSMIHTDASEGEVIRYYRMAVQMLRELADAPVSAKLKEKLEVAVELLNRDVVDAARQLMAGL